MALSITINKVAVADSFAAGTKVADIVVSGGTSPYSYSLASGGDYFQISGTEVQVIDEMNISNIQSFSVFAKDSTSGEPASGVSEEVYPNITAKIQSRFNSAGKIYKITQDIDLGHGVLTIPSGCTLDFQGGVISNGVLLGNRTKIKVGLQKIFELSLNIEGVWSVIEGFPEWFGALGDGSNDDSPFIKKSLNSFEVTKLIKNYKIGTTIQVINSTLMGESIISSFLNVEEDIDAIIVHAGASIKNFSIKINNDSYSHSAIILKDSTDNRNEDFSSIKDIDIRMTPPEDAMCAENSIGVSLISDTGRGLYYNEINRVNVEFARIAFYVYAGNELNQNCWVNSNYIINCRAMSCGTAIKTRTGSNSEIKGNVFDVTFQNNINYVVDYIVYDLITGYTNAITQNTIKGKIWDIKEDLSTGCFLGNAGGNIVETDYKVIYQPDTNSYNFLGTLIASSEGLSTLHLKANSYITEEEVTLCSYGGALTASYAICHYVNLSNSATPAPLIKDLYYKNIDGIYYIYYKCAFSGYLTFSFKDSYNFTPSPYMGSLSSLPESTNHLPLTIRFINPNLPAAFNDLPITSNETSAIGVSAYDVDSQQPVFWSVDYNSWLNALGMQPGRMKGETSLRPSLSTGLSNGYMYFDYTLNRPIWYRDSKWWDANGIEAASSIRGNSSNRPSLTEDQYGVCYYDLTLKKPIWWTGTKWVDATGTDV